MTAPSAPVRPSAFAVFRKPAFTLLWIGQFVSTIGSSLTSLAAGILVYRLTDSAMSVGLMLMVTAINTFANSPVSTSAGSGWIRPSLVI